VFLIALILIFIVLIVLSVYIYFCTRIGLPVSASEPRCSIISVHFICLLIDFHIYLHISIQLNSICMSNSETETTYIHILIYLYTGSYSLHKDT